MNFYHILDDSHENLPINFWNGSKPLSNAGESHLDYCIFLITS